MALVFPMKYFNIPGNEAIKMFYIEVIEEGRLEATRTKLLKLQKDKKMPLELAEDIDELDDLFKYIEEGMFVLASVGNREITTFDTTEHDKKQQAFLRKKFRELKMFEEEYRNIVESLQNELDNTKEMLKVEALRQERKASILAVKSKLRKQKKLD